MSEDLEMYVMIIESRVADCRTKILGRESTLKNNTRVHAKNLTPVFRLFGVV